MKSFLKNFTLIIFVIAIFLTDYSFCAAITKKEVTVAAKSFIGKRVNSSNVWPAEQTSSEIGIIDEVRNLASNTDNAYVARLSPKGFMVISADTDLEPVIAWSFRHDWPADTSQANIFYQILKTDLNLRMKYIHQIPAHIRSE